METALNQNELLVEQTRCCDRSPLVTGSRISSSKKIVVRDTLVESRATLRSQYFYVRHNDSLFGSFMLVLTREFYD